MIYLDHAATTPVPAAVADAMYDVLRHQFGNPSAQYPYGRESAALVDRCRAAVAQGLGCRPEQLFFTSCGTESDNWAISAAVWQGRHVGRHIITTALEHSAILEPCKWLAQQGYEITYLKPDRTGHVTAQQVADALREDTVLVSMMLVNNETGCVFPVEEVAQLLKARGSRALLHCDAVQGFLKIPCDPVRWGVDLMSLSAHKIGGPKGIGVLYVREPRKLRPLIYGSSQQYGLRPGTEPAALIAGLAAAFKVTCAERRPRTAKKRALAEEFWQTLHAARPEARLHTPADGLPGLLSVGLPGRSGQRLTYQLDVAGVSVSPGAACDNRGVQEPSHVLMALGGTAAEDALSTLRFSFGSANRPGDGKEAAERLIKILEQQ